jgi:hypothetical protein
MGAKASGGASGFSSLRLLVTCCRLLFRQHRNQSTSSDARVKRPRGTSSVSADEEFYGVGCACVLGLLIYKDS